MRRAIFSIPRGMQAKVYSPETIALVPFHGVTRVYFNEGLRRDADPLAAHRYLGKLYEDLFNDRLRAVRHYQTYLQMGGSDAEIYARVWALGGGR